MVISASSQRLHGTTGELPQLAHLLFDIQCVPEEDSKDESVLDAVTAAVQARPPLGVPPNLNVWLFSVYS